MSVKAKYASAQCGKCKLWPMMHTIRMIGPHPFVFQGDKK